MENMKVYNPEGSLLRERQKEMLAVLADFAKICQENDIRWWLCSGTLLGAARHKGFIPWDDDVDVSMLKKDYRKLLKVLRKMDSEEYFYQCIQTDPDHTNPFGFFRRKKGKSDSTDPRSRYFKFQGAGIDVFYIEKSSRFSAHMSKFFYQNMQYPTKKIRNRCLRHFMIRCVQFLNFVFLFQLSRLVGLFNPKQEYHYAHGSGFYDEPFYMKNIFPLTTIEFEGMTFPAPGDTDAHLTAMYGDWRKLPTEEQIRKALHSKAVIEEIFGKE